MKKILLLTFVILFIPIIIIGVDHKEEIIQKINYGSINNKIIKLKRNKTGNIENIPLEKYVLGVVAGEMPANFNIEALKAQAVASRTYVLKKINKENLYDVEDSITNQVYIDENKMREKWQNNYEKNFQKIKEAVEETKGEAILYNSELIDAVFFSTSNGYTENSSEVFSSQKPYLVSVESSWDKLESPVFYSTKEISKQEFLFNLGFNNYDTLLINNIVKTSSGRVKTININGKNFEGIKIRNIFSLRSTSFNISINDEKVVFNVNGYGHGVGMSQYGANGMAKAGYNYIEILKYYYKNCEIKKIN